MELSPMPKPKLTGKQKAVIAATAAAVAVAAPIAQRWEGYRGKAYYDPAHILSQCYGETAGIRPDLIYSKDECAMKLRARMARDYAPVIIRCIPAFSGGEWPRYSNTFGALLDASYNAGPERVCAKFAPMVNARDTVGACNALPSWFVTARDRRTGARIKLPGLVNRRRDERKVCLS